MKQRRNKRRAALRRRRMRVLVVAGIAVLAVALFAIALFTRKKPAEDSSLLCAYEYKNEVMADVEPVTYIPTAFAANLATIPDESVYYDVSIATGAAVIINTNSREVLHSEASFQKMAPASTTKLITLLVALREGNLDETVVVADEAIHLLQGTGSSVAGLKIGDQMKLRDMLYALMLPSGNDAANAIAFHIGGSIEGFAEKMNAVAAEIGASKSHFVNPHGLDHDEHYTTAYDLYLFFNELLNYEEFLPIVGATNYTATYLNAAGTTVSKTWYNTNGLLNGEYAAPSGVTVLGGKTGTTTNAMYCLTLSSQAQNGDVYISIVLKSGTRPRLYENMINLLRKIPN